MIATMFNLLFGCRHRRLSRPMTPVHKRGGLPGVTYVVCLECGKQFHYDATKMRMGSQIPACAASYRPASGPFQSQC